MQTRINKGPDQEFTTISTSENTYELWNSLTSEQETYVLDKLGLEKGNLPLSKKNQERQRLLFGQGAFGKVRLAHSKGELFAVKKISIDSPKEKENLEKEYNFGKLLKATNIPHVAYAIDGVFSEEKQKYYLFIDKIASFGDGVNFKTLLSYLNSQEQQRSAILKHVTRSLLESAATLHENGIYHRDIKANNVLFNSVGQVYLSDFGSATTTNRELIANILNEDTDEYSVSDKSDRRYFSPELHVALATNQGVPAEYSCDFFDNWRLGLTLLQLCGAAKEDEGILAHRFDWLNKLDKTGPKDKLIKDRFEKEIQKIKTESLEKIPTELREIIFGLLEIDCEKRLTAKKALTILEQSPTAPTHLQDLTDGYKNLVHSQIAATVKKGIKKALKQEAEGKSDKEEWLKNALNDLKGLWKNPGTSPKTILDFLSRYIPDQEKLPNFTDEHYRAALEIVQKQAQPLPSQKIPSDLPQSEAAQLRNIRASNYHPLPRSSQTKTASLENADEPLVSSPKVTEKDHYTDLGKAAKEVAARSAPKTEEKDNYTDLGKAAKEAAAGSAAKTEQKDHYTDLGKAAKEAAAGSAPKTEEKDHYIDLVKAAREAAAGQSLTGQTAEKEEFEHLENNLMRAADDMLSYAKKTFSQSLPIKKLEEILNTMKAGIHGIKKSIKPIEIAPKIAHKDAIDKNALTALFARTEQIVSQLTLGKLMGFNQQEVAAVTRMLEKDKQFLENLADKTPETSAKQRQILDQINEKLQLVKRLSDEKQMHLSTNQLHADELLQQQEPGAKFYVARNIESKTEYTFSEFKGVRTYQLPSPVTNLFRNFVATQAVQVPKKLKNVYIYTSKEEIGKSIAHAISQLDKNNPNLRIYLNDRLLSSEPKPAKNNLFHFFKKRESKIELPAKFTVEEIAPHEKLLRK